MSLYRKKPVVIEARQLTFSNADELAEWCGGAVVMVGNAPKSGDDRPVPALTVETLEGPMTFRPPWWVIKGVKGEFYGCKADVFAASYDPADPLPGWNDLSDLDKGAALLHQHKREWEGAEYAESDYPCRYFDHPALTALGPLEASRHAASLEPAVARLLEATEGDDWYARLYDAALDADRARR
jgi:hypothetical protein